MARHLSDEYFITEHSTADYRMRVRLESHGRDKDVVFTAQSASRSFGYGTEDLLCLIDAFHEVDKDADGVITFDEFYKFLPLPPPPYVSDEGKIRLFRMLCHGKGSHAEMGLTEFVEATAVCTGRAGACDAAKVLFMFCDMAQSGYVKPVVMAAIGEHCLYREEDMPGFTPMSKAPLAFDSLPSPKRSNASQRPRRKSSLSPMQVKQAAVEGGGTPYEAMLTLLDHVKAGGGKQGMKYAAFEACAKAHPTLVYQVLENLFQRFSPPPWVPPDTTTV